MDTLRQRYIEPVKDKGSLMDKIAEVREAERKAVAVREARQAWLDQLREQYAHQEIMVDPDDPRTVIGLNAKEVAYVRGEVHSTCGKVNCDCDEKFELDRSAGLSMP